VDSLPCPQYELDFVMEGVERAKTEITYRWLIVANDATNEVRADPRITIDFQNDNPNEFYINRVYRAWNEGFIFSPTQLVVNLSNDMYVSDYWLDEMVALKRKDPKTIPCGLLVESGRIPSAMPEYVKNFGLHPNEFRANDFLAHAKKIRDPGKEEPGRLCGPTLFDRQEWMDLGMYPEGNPQGIPGDRFLYEKYQAKGYRWVTCKGAIVAHLQTGEQEWPERKKESSTP
ncbi:MAG: hypothetical protein ACE5I8_08570, partial [Thermodesulfobacteriota bacterium]